MGSTQQFSLKWNNYQGNLISVFDTLLKNEYLVDVTLSCEGSSIKAHKLVLAACSPFFEELFRNNPCKHPIIILKDMVLSDLEIILKFMYKGEVSISQDKLSSLLKAAQSLKIKGLIEMESDGDEQSSEATSSETSGSQRRKFDEIDETDILTSEESKPPPMKFARQHSKQTANVETSPQSSFSNDPSRGYSSSFYNSSSFTSPKYQNLSSPSQKGQTSKNLSKPLHSSNFTQHSTTAATDSNTSCLRRSKMQQISSPSQTLPENNVSVKRELCSPDIIEDDLGNNQEYILEPTEDARQNISDEVQYPEEKFIMDQSMAFSKSSSNFDDSRSEDVNPNFQGLDSNKPDFDPGESYDGELAPDQISDANSQQSSQGNNLMTKDGSSIKKACPYCMKLFHPLSVRRHVKSVHFPTRVVCPFCNKTFCRNDVLRQHVHDVHRGQSVPLQSLKPKNISS